MVVLLLFSRLPISVLSRNLPVLSENPPRRGRSSLLFHVDHQAAPIRLRVDTDRVAYLPGRVQRFPLRGIDAPLVWDGDIFLDVRMELP